MESVSRSRLPSKKSSSSNGYAGKAVYDDVFGGPPQFGVPTLSPRAEDYTEIFESFHSSRASSIPVLDLPVVDRNDLAFDVRSSKFDYSEVFGGFNTLDFAVSYEELFNLSSGGYDSSDEDWTPAQSDSLSDGSDPFACPEKNQTLSDPDTHQPFDSSEQINVSYDKANQKEKEDISNHVIYVNNFQVQNELEFSIDVVGAATEGKRLRKTMSQPSNSNFGVQKEGFVSISNISLRTQPSQVPPPSRPPPPLAVNKGDIDELGLKLRASKSCAFERVSGESSPPYFDVEIDASSSAAASAAAMKDAVEKAQAKLNSAKELMERKKEVQSRTKLRLESDLKLEREENGNNKKMEVHSSSVEGEKKIKLMGKSRERKHGKERGGSAMWTEGSQFYEVVEKEQIKEEKDLLENAKFGESGPRKKGVAEVFPGQQEKKANVKAVNEADKCEELQHPFERQLKENQVEVKEKLNGANGNYEKNESDSQSKGFLADEDYKRELKEAEEVAEKLELETKMKQQKEEDNVREAKVASEVEPNPKNLEEFVEKKEDESNQRHDSEGEQACEEDDDNKTSVNGVCEEENDGIIPKEAQTLEEYENSSQEACEIEESETGEVFFEEGSIGKRSTVASEKHETGDLEGLRGAYENLEHTGKEESERIVNLTKEYVQMTGHNSHESDKYESDSEKVESPQGTLSCEEDARTEKELEVVEGLNIRVQEKVNSYGTGDFQYEINSRKVSGMASDLRNANISTHKCEEGSVKNVNETSAPEERDREERSERETNLENERLKKIEQEKERERENERLRKIEEEKKRERENERLRKIEEEKERERENERLRKIEDEKKRERERESERLRKIEEEKEREREKERLRKIEEEKKRERERENKRLRQIEEEKERERESENERLRKIEEEREREREREKDRMAMDRANLESRERATGEAKRAERAAVERATSEFRQRAMQEAREKLEKATAEARLRAEQRAAVERATAEARERAAEKVLRHSYSSSDLEGSQFQNVGPSSGSRFLHSSLSFGVESESAQRCKARLERHRRTAERAANALAEKNKRDLLAQREQAERNRLAENLDAEIKRWSSGKEGNLRALLSTLQYILGPDSGWQPVPLTEVITAVAVKKAYRKATLCVHPDKLQQRGATIHQKYICEKVFDLLKEAWNKFNSEER